VLCAPIAGAGRVVTLPDTRADSSQLHFDPLSIYFIWSIWFVWLISLNQPHETDRIDQTDLILRHRRHFGAIDKIAWPCGRISGDLLGVAWRDIFFQPPEEPEKLHTGRYLA
jgi:hypothetical protein